MTLLMSLSLHQKLEPSSISTLECTPLGDSYILHSPLSDAIILSNQDGYDLYHDLREGRSSSAHADILQAWHEAGLLDTQKPAFPTTVTYRPISKPYQQLQLKSEHNSLHIRCDDEHLFRQIQEVFTAYSDEISNSTSAVIEIISIANEFGVFLNQQPLWGSCNIDLARNLVFREAAAHLCNPENVGAILHASCATNQDNKTLLITQKSGYGKSTLTAGLVAAGFNFMADDVLPLHRNGKAVFSFPTPIGLKAGSLNLREAKELGFEEPNSTAPRYGVTYNQIRNAVPLGQTSAVSAIIFPHFGERHRNEITLISPETALQQLIEAGGRTYHKSPSIIPIATLLNHVPAYNLSYSSSDYSVQTCLKLTT